MRPFESLNQLTLPPQVECRLRELIGLQSEGKLNAGEQHELDLLIEARESQVAVRARARTLLDGVPPAPNRPVQIVRNGLPVVLVPSLIGADERRFAAALCYHDRDVDEELTLIDKTRQQMSRILHKLPADGFGRVGLHNERGPLTLEQLLTAAINHILHHAKFIHEKRGALGMS